MSHKATNWAVQQRGIRPAAKVVLWHLADRHNPDNGCFPSQRRLAEDCEISESSLNNQLKDLEAAGLIRRVQRIDPDTRRQMSTRYILGFEKEFKQEVEQPAPEIGDGPTTETGDGADSKNEAEPTPKSQESRPQKLESNPVREPRREPDAPREGPGPIKPAQVKALFAAYHEEGTLSAAEDTVIVQLGRPLMKIGSMDRLIAAARVYTAKIKAAKSKPKSLQNWLQDIPLIEKYAPPVVDESDPDRVEGLTPREWQSWVGAFDRNGEWEDRLGPRPDHPDCRAPQDVLKRYGYGELQGA